MTDTGWALKAVEDAAMHRAVEMLERIGPERLYRILGLNLQQIIFLRHQWQKDHPGEPVPEFRAS